MKQWFVNLLDSLRKSLSKMELMRYFVLRPIVLLIYEGRCEVWTFSVPRFVMRESDEENIQVRSGRSEEGKDK